MKILGIETSCDETALAVVEQKGKDFFIKKDLVFSQIPIHKKYGGVVPEVAARAHVENLPALLEKLNNKTGKNIDAIAVVNGPGLITSLRVGVELAKTLSYLWQKPLIAINHIEAHVLANWLSKSNSKKIKFPAIALVVSGGHTELILMKKMGEYKKIGQTLDDAAGEAFDKVAKMLGLGYPGGPAVSARARQGRADAIDFPRPLVNKPNFDFSFSGLKTAVLYEARKNPKKLTSNKYIADLCASFQEAVVDTLVAKTIKAGKKYQIKTIMLAGGVSANQWLRKEMGLAIKKFLPKTNFVMPNIKYTGDNAAMVAAAGALHAKKKDFIGWKKIEVNPNLSLG
jgi:N6-L-threonylcarbamoyladenine synthase